MSLYIGGSFEGVIHSLTFVSDSEPRRPFVLPGFPSLGVEKDVEEKKSRERVPILLWCVSVWSMDS